MNVDRLRPALVVVLGVLAISAAAASMDGATSNPTVGAGSGDGSGSGDSTGNGFSDSPRAEITNVEGYSFWNWLQPALAVVFGLGTLAYVGYVVYEIWTDGIEGVRSVIVHALSTVIPVGLAWLAIFGPHVLRWMNAPIEPPSAAAAPGLQKGGGSSSAEAVDTATQGMPALLLIVGTLVTLAVVVLLLKHLLSGEDDETPIPSGGSDGDETELSGPVHVDTGTAMADVDATNDVYRAWRDLASEVDGVDLRTHTPAEVADRASERGFDQQAVRTITDLFEEVRYGQRPATSERESRARSALDRAFAGSESR